LLYRSVLYEQKDRGTLVFKLNVGKTGYET
jgi:hypothetical protein